MGQVALGLRSLAVRVAVFVVMAALLAWVLGGTLFPSPQRVNFPAWEFAGSQWNWRVSGSGSEAGATSWSLFERRGDGHASEQRFGVEGNWRNVWGPRFDGGAMLIGVAVEPDGRGARDSRNPGKDGLPPSSAHGSSRVWRLIRVEPAPDRRAEITTFACESDLLEALGPAPNPAPD